MQNDPLITRLLAGDVPVHTVAPSDADTLANLRKARQVICYSGPGEPWYRLTRRGKIELIDQLSRPARPEPMF